MLHLVIGTMKASKSATLIDFVNDIENINYKIFFPACCNKKDGSVISRDIIFDNGKCETILLNYIYNKKTYDEVFDFTTAFMDTL